MRSAGSAFLAAVILAGVVLVALPQSHRVSAADPAPPPASAFSPQSFAGSASFPFSIPTGFEEPAYLYYVAIDPARPTTVRVVAGDGDVHGRWQINLDLVSLIKINRPGDYHIEASGEGTVLVFAMPPALQSTGTFSGLLPAGTFSFGFSKGMWGSHPRVEVGLTAAAPVTADLYVLHDELDLVAGAEVGTSSTFVRESSRFDWFHFLVVHNPETEPVAASVYVLGSGEWPLEPGTFVPVAILAVSSSVAIFLAWRSRRRAVPRE